MWSSECSVLGRVGGPSQGGDVWRRGLADMHKYITGTSAEEVLRNREQVGEAACRPSTSRDWGAGEGLK